MKKKTKAKDETIETPDVGVSLEILNRRLTDLEKKLGLQTFQEHVREADGDFNVVRRIENLELFISGRTALGYYDKVFDGCNACALTDIDGTIERKGFFLFLELKASGASWSIPLGQKIYFDRLDKHEKMTVLFRWGDVGKTERIQIKGVHQYAEPCTEAMFVSLLKAWWSCVNVGIQPDMKDIWDTIFQESRLISKPKGLYSNS